MLQLNQSIQATIEGVNRYIKSWQRHHSLWKTDKSSVLDKFKSREPGCAVFEEKLMKYSKARDALFVCHASLYNCAFVCLCAIFLYNCATFSCTTVHLFVCVPFSCTTVHLSASASACGVFVPFKSA